MKELPSCFKAYDIRGHVPEDLSPALARAVGQAYVAEIRPSGPVVVGRDMRLESPDITAALIQGLTEAGAAVIDIGECGTEEVCFQTFHRAAGGGVMITASNNPKGFNGMKLVREGARPISGEINYRVADTEQLLSRIEEHFASESPAIDRTDGLSLEFDNWRMYVRASNTEPLLRLNVETRVDARLLKEKVAEVESLINS